ncbi:MAG: SH3 domain-containing protein [Campylobacterota bacterium]|nr:SH3 domain-containing protein [Campylobacterota bacterium]
MFKTSIFFSIIFTLLVTGCSIKKDEPIYDIEHFSQTPSFYKKSVQDRATLLDIQKNYLTKYYIPWHLSRALYDKNESMWPYSSYTPSKSYGMNLQKIDEKWFEDMKYLSNFENYGEFNKSAISLESLDMRNFPTQMPLFYNPSLAGEGFPFDYLQNSGVHANEPLYVSHYSKNREWVYIFTSYASGWVKSKDIALVDDKMKESWQSMRSLYITQDDYPILTKDGIFLFNSKIGMILPLIEENEEEYRILVARKNIDEMALFDEVILPKSIGSSRVLILNRDNLNIVFDSMKNEIYGWGGYLSKRDCSSTARDLFAPFGIWLPRNSLAQAKIGEVIDLKNLSKKEKIEVIKNRAVPFETLFYKKGHIMIFLGIYEDNIMIFHNMWGVKTNFFGIEGRRVIGKAVVSTLNIGENLSTYDKESNLLKNITSMNIITHKKSN